MHGSCLRPFAALALAALAACASVRQPSLPPPAPRAPVAARTVPPPPPPEPGPQEDSDRIPVGRSPVRGPAEALVTIVAFSDFECPFCARVAPTLERVRERFGDDVRVVFKHNPLPFHPHAREAAEASMEAYAQRGAEGFWQYHDLLFKNQRSLERADLERYAEQLQLDMNRFRAALDQHAHADAIDADMALARTLGLTGTPSFMINGTEFVGARSYQQFAELIERVLARAREISPRERAYAAMVANPLPTPESPSRPAARPRAPELDPDARYRVPIEGAPALGSAGALVTVVAFSDFQCPYCARVQPTLAELRQRYGHDLRLVFRHHPLAFHQQAALAAEAAHEAFVQRGPRGFWRYHDLLFAHQRDEGGLERPALERYAREVRLNLRRFRAALDRRTHQSRIEHDSQLATSLGADGTPSFFINGRRLVGAQPIERFVAVIDRERDEARARVAAGTPRRAVYQAITADGATAPVYLPTPAGAPQPPAPP
jgi:protein-disulfide isomerase